MDERILTGQDPEVYRLIGPFAMDRAVIRELGGYPITTSPEHRWVVLLYEPHVVAFGGLVLLPGDRARWDWTWVLPNHRRRGLFTAIARRKVELSAGRTVTTCTSNVHVQAVFESLGLTRTHARGAWVHYEGRF